ADAGGRAGYEGGLSGEIDVHAIAPLDAGGDIGRGRACRNRRYTLDVDAATATANKKSGAEAPLSRNLMPTGLRRLGFLGLDRTGVLALGVDVAIDELDHGHWGVVAVAEAGLDDAGVAALAVLVAGRERVEQLPDLILVA